MNARQKLHHVHLQEWSIRFANQKVSGLTVRQWCEQNSLSFHTYNYWKHLLKEEVVDQPLPDIVPLSLPVPCLKMLITDTLPVSTSFAVYPHYIFILIFSEFRNVFSLLL